jgi:hypothetical protein
MPEYGEILLRYRLGCKLQSIKIAQHTLMMAVSRIDCAALARPGLTIRTTDF